MNLEEKVVMIIGAGRGIGRASAELFSNADANIVISSRTEAELLEVEYKFNSEGNTNVLALAADATNEQDVKNLVDKTVKRFGRIDYFVYAADFLCIKNICVFLIQLFFQYFSYGK